MSHTLSEAANVLDEHVKKLQEQASQKSNFLLQINESIKKLHIDRKTVTQEIAALNGAIAAYQDSSSLLKKDEPKAEEPTLEECVAVLEGEIV